MIQPVFIVAKLWIRPGQLSAFEAYERRAADIMKRYGGYIEKVLRRADAAASDDGIVEVHVLRFPSLESFTAYRSDAELDGLRELRESAIERTEIFIGKEISGYSI